MTVIVYACHRDGKQRAECNSRFNGWVTGWSWSIIIPRASRELRPEGQHLFTAGWRNGAAQPPPLKLLSPSPTAFLWGRISIFKALCDPRANMLGKYNIKGGCSFPAASRHESPCKKTWDRVLRASPRPGGALWKHCVQIAFRTTS